jgi:hypothetical protein
MSQLAGYGTSESRPYLVGPMVQVNLPHGFAVEADALYSRFGYSAGETDLIGDFYAIRDRANAWQFPVLLKYHVPVPVLHPYVLAGWDPEHVSGTTTVNAILISNPYDPNFTRTYQRSSTTDSYATDHGLVLGGGVEFVARHFRLSPEIRYVRWKNPLFSQESRTSHLLVPQNEIQILLGISFR